MRNVWIIARLTLRLAVRSGSLLAAVILPAAVAAGIFWSATGDKTLVNELQVRLHYAYALSYALAMLLVIVAAALAVRNQIDERQMHVLDSRPVSRRQIWLGKWLGMIGYAAAIQIISALTLLICAVAYTGTYEPDQVAAAKDRYLIANSEHHAKLPDLNKLTRSRIDELVRRGQLEQAALSSDDADQIWDDNMAAVRRVQQSLPPGKSITRPFDLGAKPAIGELVQLKFRLIGSDDIHGQPLYGLIRLRSTTGIEAFETPYQARPSEYQTIDLPISAIPADGRFEIEIDNRSKFGLLLQTENGLRIYAKNCSLMQNLLRAQAMQLIHLSVVAAVGLVAGVAFTFPVAAFCSLVLYLLSVFAGLFAEVAGELRSGISLDMADKVALAVIGAGTSLAKGLAQPSVIQHVSTGIAVPIADMLESWLPLTLVYLAVTILIGLTLLTRKELDRLH